MTDLARELGRRCRAALVAEAALWPKPGLVTPFSQGAHRDMNFDTFKASAAALEPWFGQLAQLGATIACQPAGNQLPLLRSVGLKAERAMLAATGSVNTHRGALFLLGLAAAAAGRLVSLGLDVEPTSLRLAVAQFAQGLEDAELRPLTDGRRPARTAGERAYGALRLRGARGEAEDGLPLVTLALGELEQGRLNGQSTRESRCRALLVLMAHNGDTVVWNRAGTTGLLWLQTQSRRAFEAGAPGTPAGRRALKALEEGCLTRWISPGGSADLLAAAVLLESFIRRPLSF